MFIKQPSFLILFLSACVFALCSPTPASDSSSRSADVILLSGNIYTLDWGEPDGEGKPAKDAPFDGKRWFADAQAMALDDGKIIYIGKNSNAMAYRTDNTRIINLSGATVIPGLIDSHVHIAELGQVLQRVNLNDVGSPSEAIEKLRRLKNKLGLEEWVLGQGWDEGAWADNYPTRQMLDLYFPDNPVYLRSLHGFAVWVNTKALEAVGIDAKTKDPVGGEIRRDKHGMPTGILLNRATALVADKLPAPTIAQFADSIELGMQQMVQDGYVAVHQAGAEALHIAAFEELNKDHRLLVRMYAMLSARDGDLMEEWQAKGPQIDPDGFLDIRSVKAYYDGALGSRGARLLKDYADKPGHRGVSGSGYGFDAKIVGRMIDSGFQVGIHAIGDAGNREVLDFLRKMEKRSPNSAELRHRVEHAQVINQADFKRFRELSLIASMEPPHAVEDKTWAEDRLGSERILGAYAWRTLRKAGVPITFNSDLPGSDHSIFYGLHAAVTRRDKQAEPSQGWYPEQNMTIEEAIRGYTSWAAYSAFREQQTGVLKKGYWADLTILDIDPFKAAVDDPAGLLEGTVMMTIINGEVVFERS